MHVVEKHKCIYTRLVTGRKASFSYLFFLAETTDIFFTDNA